MSDQAQHQTTLDSDEQQVGALYAKALLASSSDTVDQVVSDLESVVTECLNAHPALDAALASPRISAEQKEGMLERIFRDRIHPNLLNFLKVICRRGRVNNLRAIQITATTLLEQQNGKMRVSVRSAQPLSDDQRRQISDSLRQTHGKDPVLLEEVDANLIGGAVLRIGDQVIDGSVQGKMNSVERAVAGSVREAIRDRFEAITKS